jgi:photosystem II PsbY protein
VADNRLFVLLGLGLPVIGWVLFNIGQPALRQVDAMANKASVPPSKKRRSVVAGLTALTAGALMALPEAADAATELAQLSDNRLFVLLGLGLVRFAHSRRQWLR